MMRASKISERCRWWRAALQHQVRSRQAAACLDSRRKLPGSHHARGGGDDLRPRRLLAGAAADPPLAGEGLQEVAEVPWVLRDAGAGIAVPRTWASAIVALYGPDRDEVHPLRLGEVQRGLCISQRRHLGLLRVI